MVDHHAWISLRKRVLAALFLLFCFSCTNPCQQWEWERIQTHYLEFDSAKLSWWTSDPCQGVDVQIVCTTCETLIYFDLNIFEFPFIENDPLKTEVLILTDENREYCFVADRLEGGQRLLLPAEAGSLILDLLSAGSSFTISIENYSETVLSTNFDRAFQQTRKFSNQ